MHKGARVGVVHGRGVRPGLFTMKMDEHNETDSLLPPITLLRRRGAHEEECPDTGRRNDIHPSNRVIVSFPTNGLLSIDQFFTENVWNYVRLINPIFRGAGGVD